MVTVAAVVEHWLPEVYIYLLVVNLRCIYAYVSKQMKIALRVEIET